MDILAVIIGVCVVLAVLKIIGKSIKLLANIGLIIIVIYIIMHFI